MRNSSLRINGNIQQVDLILIIDAREIGDVSPVRPLPILILLLVQPQTSILVWKIWDSLSKGAQRNPFKTKSQVLSSSSSSELKQRTNNGGGNRFTAIKRLTRVITGNDGHVEDEDIKRRNKMFLMEVTYDGDHREIIKLLATLELKVEECIQKVKISKTGGAASGS